MRNLSIACCVIESGSFFWLETRNTEHGTRNTPNVDRSKISLALRRVVCFAESSLQSVKSFVLARTSRGRGAWSLLMLTVFLFLQTLAAVPALHEVFHHHANQADHQCAVTALARGQVDFTTVLVAPVQPVVQVLVHESLPPASVSLLIDYQLLPGRAPPCLPS